MNSQNLQSIVIDDRTLQQLKDEIQQEMCNMVNNANFNKILSKYGILKPEVLQFEYRIDLNKLESSDPEEDNEDQNLILKTLEGCPICTSNCTCTCWCRSLKQWIACSCY